MKDIKLTVKILSDKALSPIEKILLAYLIGEGEVSESNKIIGEATGITTRSIIDVIKRLKLKGYISVKHHLSETGMMSKTITPITTNSIEDRITSIITEAYKPIPTTNDTNEDTVIPTVNDTSEDTVIPTVDVSTEEMVYDPNIVDITFSQGKQMKNRASKWYFDNKLTLEEKREYYNILKYDFIITEEEHKWFNEYKFVEND